MNGNEDKKVIPSLFCSKDRITKKTTQYKQQKLLSPEIKQSKTKSTNQNDSRERTKTYPIGQRQYNQHEINEINHYEN